MSIADLADSRLLRTEKKAPSVEVAANEPKTKAGIPAGVLNTITAWIPVETVAGFIAIQAAMDDLVPPAGRPQCEADYTERWQLFWLMLIMSVALVPIYVGIKSGNSSTPFKWPFIEMLISGVAFTLWAIALQDSSFADFCGLKAWHSIAALVVGGAALAAISTLLKKSPAWSDAAGNNSPPSPDVR